MLILWKESYDQPRQYIKKQRHYFANKGLSSQSFGFSSSHVWMWEFDYKESWAPKNWCFWTVVLEKTFFFFFNFNNIFYLTQVQALGWEDPLEYEMATHSSILAWKIPWTEEPGGLQSMGSQSQTWLNMYTWRGYFNILWKEWIIY